MSVESAQTLDLFDYLSLLFWQAVMSEDYEALREAILWLNVGYEISSRRERRKR